MWLSSKRYKMLLQAIIYLANRPYISHIEENDNGTITFEFTAGEKVYSFTAVNADSIRRTLN